MRTYSIFTASSAPEEPCSSRRRPSCEALGRTQEQIMKTKQWKLSMAVLCSLMGLQSACGDGSDDVHRGSTGGEKYAVSSVVTAMGAQTGYVNILDSMTPQPAEVAVAAANEFPGLADMWVQDGFVF